MLKKLKLTKLLFSLSCTLLVSPSLLAAEQAKFTDEEEDSFTEGRSFFHIPWVAAPSSTTARDGLGPLFSSNTCASCHIAKKQKSPLITDSFVHGLYVVRLAQFEDHFKRKTEQIALPDPVYGHQLSSKSIGTVPLEGKVKLSKKSFNEPSSDGTQVKLSQWEIGTHQMGYGPLDSKTGISIRITPPLIGLKYIENLPEEYFAEESKLQTEADPEMAGKANKVYDPVNKTFAIGKFGWKASQPSILVQSGDAALNDMGLTNIVIENESCTQFQKECLEAPRGRRLKFEMHLPDYDLPTHRLESIAFYVANLPLPPKKELTKAELKLSERGKKVFNELQCVFCHKPSLTTKDGVTFEPFSDFLLHDMGEGLSDKRPEFEASVSQWRTAPLWRNYTKAELGLGYLHDGRAETLIEAIAWHGGQAQKAKEGFLSLSEEDREALLKYLNSL